MCASRPLDKAMDEEGEGKIRENQTYLLLPQCFPGFPHCRRHSCPFAGVVAAAVLLPLRLLPLLPLLAARPPLSLVLAVPVVEVVPAVPLAWKRWRWVSAAGRGKRLGAE